MGISQEPLASVYHKKASQYIFSVLHESIQNIFMHSRTFDIFPGLKYIRMNRLRITRETLMDVEILSRCISFGLHLIICFV